MGEKIKNVIIFALGAAVGSAATWVLLKTKYEQLADDEIEEVREYYREKIYELENLSDEEDEENTDFDDDEYDEEEEEIPAPPTRAERAKSKEKLVVTDYTKFYNKDNDENTEPTRAETRYINEDDDEGFPESTKRIIVQAPSDDPYTISPDEFGEIEEYECISLTYYQGDGYLADDMDELVNIEDTVGFDALESFGEYEDDSVHVRNDSRKCDYEILLDLGKYRDAVGK